MRNNQKTRILKIVYYLIIMIPRRQNHRQYRDEKLKIKIGMKESSNEEVV